MTNTEITVAQEIERMDAVGQMIVGAHRQVEHMTKFAHVGPECAKGLAHWEGRLEALQAVAEELWPEERVAMNALVNAGIGL